MVRDIRALHGHQAAPMCRRTGARSARARANAAALQGSQATGPDAAAAAVRSTTGDYNQRQESAP